MENLSVEEVLNSDPNNFALSYKTIEKVELKKFLGAVTIKITSDGKTYKWGVRGIPHLEKTTIADVEKILQPIFGEKLEAPEAIDD